ncbi:renalase-like isoform X2 [Stegodyphus dumicola]|uniref:renalase-like isoform X2 n=1 Tax=Stegodyphus dumicola TaxID=202533 RepID=UPI0015A76888|nr:renalase-like isoform X2 [Stegodyphus dumicola]
MHRICIVGAGITGALTAMMLKEKLQQISIIIFEKSKGTGGRMCTKRSPFGSSLDIGAQFITKTSDINHTQKRCYSELFQTGLLKPLQGTVEGLDVSSYSENYACSCGSGSIVKHFLQLADGELGKLKAVEYCSRFALSLFYKYNTNFFDNLSWTAKYISENPVLRFVSIDNLKRGKQHELPSVLIHTTKEFGKKNVDASLTSVLPVILESLENILPDMPKPSDMKVHKWRYSQVEKSYSGNPGCLVLSTFPVLICGGDGLSFSTFEGCILSAESIVKNFTENFVT